MSANVLIADRGEIACGLIRSARRLRMHAIVLHTPADRGALFTRMANEAIKASRRFARPYQFLAGRPKHRPNESTFRDVCISTAGDAHEEAF